MLDLTRLSNDSRLPSAHLCRRAGLVARHPRVLMSISQVVIQRMRRQTARYHPAPTETAMTLAVVPADGDGY